MYGPQSYPNEARLSNSPQLGRAYSPRLSGIRPNPRLADAKGISSQFSKELDNSSVSEFIGLIQGQLKRLNGSFTFQNSSELPLSQAISYLTQAVDSLITERSKTSMEKLEEIELESEKLKEELDKAKETTKNLKKYEILLKKKEEKLEEEKSKLVADKKAVKELEEQLRTALNGFDHQETKWMDSKKYEQEQIKFEREEADKMLAEARNVKEKLEKKFEETTKHMKYEKETLSQLESSLNQTKKTLAADQKRLTQEKLDLEREKWKIDQCQRKIEEAEIILNVKTEQLEDERMQIEAEKLKMQALCKEIEEEKTALVQIKEQMLLEDPSGKISSYEPNAGYGLQMNSDYDLRAQELDEREGEIEQAYKELQEQMDNFNRELGEREIILDERELAIEKQEKEIKKKFDNFTLIESSLIESKIQVEDLRTYTIPELEKQSEILDSLLQELNDKKLDVETLTKKLQAELSSVKKAKNQLEVIKEDMPQNGNREIDDIAQELEAKLAALREREEDLEHEHTELEQEKAKLVKAAEVLKKANLELEDKKKQYEKDMTAEKEKLKSSFLKLESGMRLLSTKETEVFAFKRKLDERNQMLTIKEKEINTRTSSLTS